MLTIRRKARPVTTTTAVTTTANTSPLDKFDAFLQKAHLSSPVHQREGLVWCAEKEQANKSGGIIADEMGMGKTILMLGLMVSNFKRHTLIVVPKSLLVQWTREIQDKLHHTPYVLYGSGKTKSLTAEVLASKPIVLTTFGTCNTIGMSSESVLHKFKFDRVIVDEAHHLRNDKTKSHIAVDTLQKDVLWLLTGTPVQNKLQDLFSLLKLLKIPCDSYKKMDDLANIIKANMLMRKKAASSIVLPTLNKHVCGIKWKSADEQDCSKVFHQGYGTTSSGRNIQDAYNGITKHRLVAILHAQMLCIGPQLLKRKMDKYCDENECDYSEGNDEFFSSTTKLDAVCDKIASNHVVNCTNKKLVFCHFRKEMDIIQDNIETKGTMSVAQYHGGLSSKQRGMMIESSPDVLILQIKSGCEGLNLQQYNEVYFVSPTWNPSLESQALARCYRMGQQKETHVYRFYMEDFEEEEEASEESNHVASMDSRIEMRQQEKIEMANQIDAMCVV